MHPAAGSLTLGSASVSQATVAGTLALGAVMREQLCEGGHTSTAMKGPTSKTLGVPMVLMYSATKV